MFFRVKSSGPYRYLQLVENHREGHRTVQRVLLTLGRLDELTEAGSTDTLLRSLARFGQRVQLTEGADLEKGPSRRLGPDLAFGRLWQDTGVQQALNHVLRGRPFEFPVERAVYLAVLHRLFAPGSDRDAHIWSGDVVVPGAEGLALHHLYRAMRWLGGAGVEVEEALFAGRRDPLAGPSPAFFHTAGLYFQGAGGDGPGQEGSCQRHRPDLHQVAMGVVLTQDGRPVCCELWPGDHGDAASLLPVMEGLRQRFGLGRLCWVAGCDTMGRDAMATLEDRGLEYILGARMRQGELNQAVVERAGACHEVEDSLWVKEVVVEGRRCIICHNPQEAARDAREREAIAGALEDEMAQGERRPAGSRGYRRSPRGEKDGAGIDLKQAAADARCDGRSVLTTNTPLPAGEVAAQYRRLQLVEQLVRSAGPLPGGGPIFRQGDAAIRGHMFCSFLALVLVDELQRRLASRGHRLEWDAIRRDLESLDEARVRQGSQWYLLRGPLRGAAGEVLQSAGATVPPPVLPA